MVYLVYTVLGVGVGATQVGYLAAQTGQPVWLTVAIAVVPFLGAVLGLTAASNTRTGATETAVSETTADYDAEQGEPEYAA